MLDPLLIPVEYVLPLPMDGERGAGASASDIPRMARRLFLVDVDVEAGLDVDLDNDVDMDDDDIDVKVDFDRRRPTSIPELRGPLTTVENEQSCDPNPRLLLEVPADLILLLIRFETREPDRSSG